MWLDVLTDYVVVQDLQLTKTWTMYEVAVPDHYAGRGGHTLKAKMNSVALVKVTKQSRRSG